MSIFGDDGVDDLLNDNIPGEERLFGDDDEQEVPEGNEPNPSGTSVKVQPKKRAVVNPRPRLTVETLRGPRGLHTIEDYFKDVKFKGKGYEKHDLDEILRRLQHWGHRMYPTYKFDDIILNIERLGKKKPLQVHMSRYRLGMLESIKTHGDLNEGAEDGDDVAAEGEADEPFDEFDALLDEQIAISKIAPRTPATNISRYSGLNVNSSIASSSFGTPSFSRANAAMSTPYVGVPQKLHDIDDLASPLPPSQPSTPPTKQQLTAEQMARIAENRRLAQERLAAKKLAAQQQLQQQKDMTEE